jgi:hypothetical protein
MMHLSISSEVIVGEISSIVVIKGNYSWRVLKVAKCSVSNLSELNYQNLPTKTKYLSVLHFNFFCIFAAILQIFTLYVIPNKIFSLNFFGILKNEHVVHSPFVFNLITKCFYDKHSRPEYAILETYRNLIYRIEIPLKSMILQVPKFSNLLIDQFQDCQNCRN